MKLKRTMRVPNGFQRDNGEDQHNWMDDEMQKFGETINAKWIDEKKTQFEHLNPKQTFYVHFEKRGIQC